MSVRLRVDRAKRDDVYLDIVRIAEPHRFTTRGKPIRDGECCVIKARGNKCFALIRGRNEETDPVIKIDERLRNKLGVQPGKVYDFDLAPAWLPGQLRWAWTASEPAYRVAARMAVLSIILGLVGLILGGVSLWVALK